VARLTLAPNKMGSDGAPVTTVAVNADGYALPNDGTVFLYVKNTNAASAGCDVAFGAEEVLDGLTLPDKTITVALSEEYLFGPFNRRVYNRTDAQTDPGHVHIDFTGATADLEIQAFRFPR